MCACALIGFINPWPHYSSSHTVHTVIVGPQHVTIRGVPAIIPSAVYRWHMTNKTVCFDNFKFMRRELTMHKKF